MNATKAKNKAMENLELKTSDVYEKLMGAVLDAADKGRTECAILTEKELTEIDNKILKYHGFVVNQIGTNITLGYYVNFTSEGTNICYSDGTLTSGTNLLSLTTI